MRAMLIALGFVLATVSAALAADKGGAPAAPIPVADIPALGDQWTGPYIEGGFAGRYFEGEKVGMGVAGIGYNFRPSINIPTVIGAFARYGFSVEGRDSSALLTFDQPWTIGARAGYLVQPSTLIYGLGGYSQGRDLDKGWIVGAGIEQMMLGKFSVGPEYHAQFITGGDVIHEIGVFARMKF